MLLKTPDNSCDTELDGYWFIITVLWLHILGVGGGGGSGGVSLQHYLFQNEIDVLSCVGNF